MSETTVTKKVSLDVEAESNVAGGLQQVQVDAKKTFDAIDKDAAARIDAAKLAAAKAKEIAAAKSAEKDPGLLKSLNSTVGEESGLKKTLDIFKGAGAVAGLTMVSESLRGIGSKMKELVVDFRTGKKGMAEIAEESAKSLPIFGGLISFGRDLRATIDGTAAAEAEALEQANKQAAIVTAQVNKLREAHQGVLDVVQQYSHVNETATQRVNREASDALKDIEQKRQALRAAGVKAGGQDDQSLDSAAAAVRAHQQKELADIEKQSTADVVRHRQEQAAALRQSETAINDAAVSARVTALRDAGREVDAQLAELDARTKSKLDDIEQRRQQLMEQGGLTNAERVARSQSLTNEADSVRDSDASQRSRIREQGARQAQADHVSHMLELDRIQIDNLHTMAALGDQVADVEAKRLEIHDKYLQQEQQLNDLLRRQDLSAEERGRAEAAKASLQQREAREYLNILQQQTATRAASLDLANQDLAVIAARAAEEVRGFNARETDLADAIGSPVLGAPAAGGPQQVAQAINTTVVPAIRSAVGQAAAEGNNNTVAAIDSLKSVLQEFISRISPVEVFTVRRA